MTLAELAPSTNGTQNGPFPDRLPAPGSSELEVRPPTLRGRRFTLLPVLPEHNRALYRMSLDEEVSYRWRYHGAVPTYDVFERTLNANVLVQFLVVPTDRPNDLRGHVVGYNANLQDGTVNLGTMGIARTGGSVVEGVILFLGYLFDVWPLRKVYAETPEFNVGQFASAVEAGYMVEEGRLREHRYYKGQYWDHLTFAIYRSTFDDWSRRHSQLFQPTAIDSTVHSTGSEATKN